MFFICCVQFTLNVEMGIYTENLHSIKQLGTGNSNINAYNLLVLVPAS